MMPGRSAARLNGLEGFAEIVSGFFAEAPKGFAGLSVLAVLAVLVAGVGFAGAALSTASFF
jgi:hypothetical protein